MGLSFVDFNLGITFGLGIIWTYFNLLKLLNFDPIHFQRVAKVASCSIAMWYNLNIGLIDIVMIQCLHKCRYFICQIFVPFNLIRERL